MATMDRAGGTAPGRFRPWAESLGGLLALALGAVLVDASLVGVARSSAASAKESAPAEQLAPLPLPPQRTPLPDEPPARIGARYDSDNALPQHAQRVASYTLFARLDAGRHTIQGSGKIRWTNRSERAARSLYFHLYLNAFKNSHTRFFRSPFQAGRSRKRPKHWGYVDVKSLTSAAWGELWKGARFRSENDGEDQTDVEVPLPKPIEPGETAEFEIAWESQLPDIVERTGYAEGFHMVAQWFPKLARREPDGRWAHFAFHPQSEFYADFGDYDVTIDVPKNMVVGATGKRMDERSHGERKIVRHRCENVHDFAWTAWEKFVEYSKKTDGVSLRVLVPPGHDKNAEVTLGAVTRGLKIFGRLFGRYPYPELTVVHPPEIASEAGGMEYPTLITTGGPWYAGHLTNFVERVAIHELAHQWFYGLVASDEHTWPFLDEGLASYAESVAMTRLFGAASGVRLPGMELDGDAYSRVNASQTSHHGIIAQPAAAFASFTDIGGLVYARTATLLLTLERVYGRERVSKALGRYARYYRYRHPSPRHLIAAFRETVGDEAAKVLESGLEGAGVDYVVQDVKTQPVASPAGYFDTAHGREMKSAEDRPSKDRWVSQAIVYREGGLVLPVDLELILDDGTRIRRRWDGRKRWTTVDYEGERRLSAVQVDPDLKILIDEDLTNNAQRLERGTELRVIERSTYIAELLLGWLGP